MYSSVVRIFTAWVLFNAAVFVAAKSLSRSMPLDKQIENYIGNECRAEKCDVLELKWPHVKKRSINSIILLSIIIFGKQVYLNLVPSKSFLVGPNTPVYYLDTQYDFLRVKVKTQIFKKEKWELYEDQKEFATIYVKINPDGSRKIEFGYIGSELYTIEPVSDKFFVNSDDYYLARANKGTDQFKKIKRLMGNFPPNPEEIYLELLLIIDYGVYDKYSRNQQLFPYLLTFWNLVNMIFRSLNDPKIEISIAGIMIAQDDEVIYYMSGNHSKYKDEYYLDYKYTMYNISHYLYNKQHIIPEYTYDIFVISTIKEDIESNYSYTFYGKAMAEGACNINESTKHLNRGVMLYERNKITDISIAAHELAHSLGVNHNKDESIKSENFNFVMSINLRKLSTKWSNSSIGTFHKASRNTNFVCLYNKPNFTNPLLDNEVDEGDDPYHSEGKWLEFYKTIHKEIRELINPREFDRKKIIEVSFENKKIIVRLKEKSALTTKNILTSNSQNFHKAAPDNEKVIIDLKFINRLENINIYHEDNFIHVYQNVDEEFYRNQQDIRPLYVSASREDTITIRARDLDRNRLVAVFYDNNKLIVTQDIRSEEEESIVAHDVVTFQWNYTVSDDSKTYIRPFPLATNNFIHFYHNKTSIYILTTT